MGCCGGCRKAKVAVDVAAPPVGRVRTIGVIRMACIGYMAVCAGPYGIEEAVAAGGPGLVLIALLILPFLWGLPQSYMTAELSNMFLRNGGYVEWVYQGLDDPPPGLRYEPETEGEVTTTTNELLGSPSAIVPEEDHKAEGDGLSIIIEEDELDSSASMEAAPSRESRGKRSDKAELKVLAPSQAKEKETTSSKRSPRQAGRDNSPDNGTSRRPRKKRRVIKGGDEGTRLLSPESPSPRPDAPLGCCGRFSRWWNGGCRVGERRGLLGFGQWTTVCSYNHNISSILDLPVYLVLFSGYLTSFLKTGFGIESDLFMFSYGPKLLALVLVTAVNFIGMSSVGSISILIGILLMLPL